MSQIECILRRAGGTKVDLDGTEYNFAPLDNGAHVAEVENERHEDRFLSIPEAYRVYRGKPYVRPNDPAYSTPAPKPVEAVKPVDDAPLGSSLHSAEYTIGEKTYSITELAYKAIESGEMTVAEWNEQSDETRASDIDGVLNALQDEFDQAEAAKAGNLAAELEREAAEKLRRETLAAQYKEKTGSLPHGKWTADKIAEALAAL